MPAVQLLHGVIETAINKALTLSSNANQVLSPLHGKVCVIYLQELSHSLCFHFDATRVDVLADSNQAYNNMPEDLPSNYCWVSVSVFALDKLKQNNQLTKLIKSGQLDFAGDLSILQNVSALFSNIDIDLEEVMSNYIGDPAAYQLNATGKQVITALKHQFGLLANTLSDAALDEKPIAVRHIMVVNFSDEVNELRAATDRLEARLNAFADKHEKGNKA